MKKVDQRRFDNQSISVDASATAARDAGSATATDAGDAAPADPSYLNGKEAAEFLGVKRQTLYAYASRGLVRSEPLGRGTRDRRYHRDDLQRLKARHDARAGHGAVAAAALRWGEPVLESALTAIEATGPRYRGQPALDLAKRVPFESVAELLWTGTVPESPPEWPGRNVGVRLRPIASLLPPDTPTASRLALAIAALAAADPDRFGAAPYEDLQRARSIVRRTAAFAGLAGGASRVQAAIEEPSVARTLLVALGARPTARSEHAMNQALVLVADHELNVSSFTARIAASAGADLYACVCAGLATLSGPRHGGTLSRIEALLAETGRPDRAHAIIHDRAIRGDEVPGFGHPLYPEGDPRGRALLAVVLDAASRNLPLQTLFALIEAMRNAGRSEPTVDFGLVALALALRLPRGSALAIFAVGRAVGWIAHAFEQRAAGFLLRPRARYVGPG